MRWIDECSVRDKLWAFLPVSNTRAWIIDFNKKGSCKPPYTSLHFHACSSSIYSLPHFMYLAFFFSSNSYVCTAHLIFHLTTVEFSQQISYTSLPALSCIFLSENEKIRVFFTVWKIAVLFWGRRCRRVSFNAVQAKLSINYTTAKRWILLFLVHSILLSLVRSNLNTIMDANFLHQQSTSDPISIPTRKTLCF